MPSCANEIQRGSFPCCGYFRNARVYLWVREKHRKYLKMKFTPVKITWQANRVGIHGRLRGFYCNCNAIPAGRVAMLDEEQLQNIMNR